MKGRADVLFYVQHLLGIGHLVRASRIAAAMAADGLRVMMISGGEPVAAFPDREIELIQLPSLRSRDAQFSGLADETGRSPNEALWARRSAPLMEALARRPQAIVIEAFPFGRRQFGREILPFLEAAHRLQHRPAIFASLRDILQQSRKAGRPDETADIIERLFDHVLVHGDPRLAWLEDTFPAARRIEDKIVYTGLVAGPSPGPPREAFDVVISAGGGAAGAELVQAAIGAAEHLTRLSWCVITGPNLALPGAAGANVRIERFRPDLPALLGGARLSVSQAGYNTVCDILQAGCRAILVPFAAGGETEQTTRAERLEKLGLARMLPEQDITSQRLAAMVTDALDRPPPLRHSLDLDGARKTAQIIREEVSKLRRSA